jgi:hypothetical protein
MGAGQRAAASGIVALATGALVLAACASPLVQEDGAFVNRERGYRIAVPPESWRPVPLEAADLAFSGPGGARMSLGSRCGTPLATPEVLSRHLVIGVRHRRLLDEGAVTLDGHAGWTRTYKVEIEGTTRYLKSVTVVAGRCVYDWVLLAGGDTPEVERTFDRWWASFRLADALHVGGS